MRRNSRGLGQELATMRWNWVDSIGVVGSGAVGVENLRRLVNDNPSLQMIVSSRTLKLVPQCYNMEVDAKMRQGEAQVDRSLK